MKQTQNNSFDSQQVLSVIEQYSMALDLLDAYGPSDDGKTKRK